MSYACPMHPEVEKTSPGRCLKCGMKLVAKSDLSKERTSIDHAVSDESYRPLFIIIGLIILVTSMLAIQNYLNNSFSWTQLMQYFMAGFFLVFSGFKLIDLNGFAQGYLTYDLLAKKWYTYGLIYPFLELILGLHYLVGFITPVVSFFTFLLMAFSGIGVAIKVARHEKFQCACLGTFLKVPLTKVTLIEDFGMASMALLMFFIK